MIWEKNLGGLLEGRIVKHGLNLLEKVDGVCVSPTQTVNVLKTPGLGGEAGKGLYYHRLGKNWGKEKSTG